MAKAYLLNSAIFLLMISVGMSLRLSQVIAEWKRLSWRKWLALTLATFVIPPALALLLANIFRLPLPGTVGVFLVGVAPGAPLLTRNLARQGFDMHLAASYQLWSALMIPIFIPLVVAAAAKLYERNIWIPPSMLLEQIALKVFLPLLVGMLIASIVPQGAQRSLPVLNLLGNVLLVLMFAAVLIKMGPFLKTISPMVPVVAALVAVGSLAAIFLFRAGDSRVKETFAICNVNRHVGLAVLISGQYPRARAALPAIACYALIAPLVMIVYARWYRPRRKRLAAGTNSQP